MLYLIQSNFGSKGDFEVLVETERGLEYWRSTTTTPRTLTQLGTREQRKPDCNKQLGNPSLIQSNFGSKGNFEALIPVTSGGVVSLQHWWRVSSRIVIVYQTLSGGSSPYSPSHLFERLLKYRLLSIITTLRYDFKI